MENIPTHPHKLKAFWPLALGSLGVVYGDIGTSPLYAFKESLASAHELSVADATTLGIASLILWALLIIVTVKYVVVILRADNHGEGGTLTLMALAQRAFRQSHWLVVLGIAGAALFYGDAIITPAISVLSAVEGLKIATPAFAPYVLPISIGILLVLFLVQQKGTASVAALFGPIMTVWFAILAFSGLVHIFAHPAVLAAINPLYGISFLATHGVGSLGTLGSVFLAVTGAEALYADMGHFGRKPIELAWLDFVLPSLALNYLGQAALVIQTPEAAANPFFLLYPDWALFPMVIFATVATVIASQAVISGTFSMTQQAIQLGLLPRMDIDRTSATEKGQIYIGRINWVLLLAVLLLVGIFKSSDALAAAYGVSVTGTMVISSVLAFVVVWKCWNWTLLRTILVMAPLLLVDVIFLGANLLKVMEGGWIPLAVGAFIFTAMITWQRGSRLLSEQTRRDDVPLQDFVNSIERKLPQMVEGTAVFLTGHDNNVPTSLMHNLKHNRILHAQNVVVSIATDDRPRVPIEERATVECLSPHFSKVKLRFGYMEKPHIPTALPECRELGWAYDMMTTSFFLSRRVLRPSDRSKMPKWQDRLFILLAHSADDAARYFGIPVDRLVEVGTQIAV